MIEGCGEAAGMEMVLAWLILIRLRDEDRCSPERSPTACTYMSVSCTRCWHRHLCC